MNSSLALAQSQAEVDAAKLKADLAEAVKREAEARKAAAVAEAEAANAEQIARAALGKAQTETEKAKLDYARAQLPTPIDPSKYTIAAPSAPTLTASATRMAFREADAISATVAEAILADLASCVTPAQAVILPDDPRSRTLLGLSRAMRESLDLANKRLSSQRGDLDRVVKQAPDSFIAAAALLPAITSIAETAVSFAKILRTQYGFATSSQLTLAEAVVLSKVTAKLVQAKCKVVDPDAIVPAPTAAAKPPEIQKLESLHAEIAASREQLIIAVAASANVRKDAPKADADETSVNSKARATAIRRAEAIDGKAKTLLATVDEVEKMLSTFLVADAQGNTPYDSALRGGALGELLKNGRAFSLTVKGSSSDVDTIAADGLFKGLRVAIASNTIARWRLTGLDGVVVSIGAVQKDTPLERVRLPD